MSQLSKVTHSRNQWKHKATQRGDQNRYQRKQIARLTAERNHATQALKAAQGRLRQLENSPQELVALPKVDVVWLALHLFLVAHIGFRAVSRVLSLLAWALGIKNAPCPQTIINWVIRLAIVRIDSARMLRGAPLRQAPFSNGLIWLIDLSIGLGTGKILAVLAVDAHHYQRTPSALALAHVHCLGVSVADSWTGDTIAALLGRLIAVMGRPAAYLKDGGGDLHKAVALLDEQGLASPCIDDIAHAVAGMLKRSYQDHPTFEAFVSACGRVSGKLKHTILACLAPPKVRTKARFMNVHRLFTWADQLLKLSPAGVAKRGIEGISWYLRVIAGVPTGKGDDRYTLFKQPVHYEFLRWLGDVIDMKTPELRKIEVIAAMYATDLANTAEARRFWDDVARGGHPYEDSHPTTTLDTWLKLCKEGKCEDTMKQAYHYQGCLYAWNAFRENRTIKDIRFSTSKGLYTPHD